jgi:hypothetical protein
MEIVMNCESQYAPVIGKLKKRNNHSFSFEIHSRKKSSEPLHHLLNLLKALN